jgi:hypothetical protein
MVSSSTAYSAATSSADVWLRPNWMSLYARMGRNGLDCSPLGVSCRLGIGSDLLVEGTSMAPALGCRNSTLVVLGVARVGACANGRATCAACAACNCRYLSIRPYSSCKWPVTTEMGMASNIMPKKIARTEISRPPNDTANASPYPTANQT